MDGYVIETRGALLSDGQGRFLSLTSLSKGSEVAAEPFLKENEAKTETMAPIILVVVFTNF